MTIKQQLKSYLRINGKPQSWVEVYNKFPYKGEISSKKKSDAVRGIYRNINKKTKKNFNKTEAKVLIYDLETSPLLSYHFRMWNNNVNAVTQLTNESIILTFSAKYLFEEEIMQYKLTPEEVLNEDDSRLVKILWDLLNEADITISHNGLKFDNKVANTRFIRNGLERPSPYQTIDTLAHARKRFKMASNRLDYLGKVLGLGRKVEVNGFNLWRDCMMGSEEALQKMADYCNGDIKLLEEVYLTMRSYIYPHPNLGLHIDKDIETCPVCASKNLKRNGEYHTYANVYENITCQDCGSHSRSRKSLTNSKNNSKRLTSIPK